MVRLTIYRDPKGNWRGFQSKGHAGGGSDTVYDLVCAAISMHLQTIEYSLEKRIRIDQKDKRDGYLEICFQPGGETEAIEEVFLNGVEILEKSYGQMFQVRNKEVESHV